MYNISTNINKMTEISTETQSNTLNKIQAKVDNKYLRRHFVVLSPG